MAIDLLKYELWLKSTGHTDPSVNDVTDTTLKVNITTGDLIWTKPNNYHGTRFGITDEDLYATAHNGTQLEDINMDADGYVLVEVDE